jgi:hypothetical protein
MAKITDYTDNEQVNNLSPFAERFFLRLRMKIDETGCLPHNIKLLRAALFPLKLHEIIDVDIEHWLSECLKAGVVRLRDKPGGTFVQLVDHKIRYTESPEDIKLKEEYIRMSRDKESIFLFIRDKHPDFAEVYVDFWNIFAGQKGLSQVREISAARRKKLQARLSKKSFSFLDIIKKANLSQFLTGSKWFDFDWIIENDHNYIKILEGKYDNKEEPQSHNNDQEYIQKRKAAEDRALGEQYS